MPYKLKRTFQYQYLIIKKISLNAKFQRKAKMFIPVLQYPNIIFMGNIYWKKK